MSKRKRQTAAPAYEQTTPPAGIRVKKPPQKNRLQRWLAGCGVLAGVCIVFAVFGAIGQMLGIIPDATERAQTRTATAAILATAQAAEREAQRATQDALASTLTIIALSVTPTYTSTPSPTFTALPVLPTATTPPTSAPVLMFSTNTPQGIISTLTNTPSASPTSQPTITPAPTQPPVTSRPPQVYYVVSPANARSCTHIDDTTCPRITQFQVGASVDVIGTTEGDENQGSRTWMLVLYQGQTVYVHSTLLSQTPPAANQSSNTSNQQLISTPVQSSGFTCNCSRTCEQITTCEEAYFQLNQCGCSARNTDDDTVPCEDICPGG